MSESADIEIYKLRDRELIVAYLSYALEDVGALSEVGLCFLQMAIDSLTEAEQADNSAAPPKPIQPH